MPSRADSAAAGRRATERVCRFVGVLSLLVALGQSAWQWRSPVAANDTPLVVDSLQRDETTGAAVARQVVPSMTNVPASPLRVELRAFPGAAVRGVLSAARESGTVLSRRDPWRNDVDLRALSLAVTTAPSPQPTWQVTAAVAARWPARAPTDSTRGGAYALRVRDSVGVLDSIRLTSGDTSLALRVARLQEPVTVDLLRDGRVIASASAPRPAARPARAVRLYARPGWEAKFTSAALEESGWRVDGTLAVSPSATVQLGGAAASVADLDSARHAAVVVLDSGVAPLRALQRFVQQGGGVVVAGEALRDPSLAVFIPARMAGERPAVAGALLTTDPQRGLAAFRLTPRSGAAVLHHEDASAMVVATRIGTARAVASGYRATWRWRMEGLDESAELHRRWWSGLVSAVALSADSSVTATRATWPGDVAPVADLVARLGPPDSRAAPVTEAVNTRVPLWFWVLLASAALVAEWALRRVRGAR